MYLSDAKELLAKCYDKGRDFVSLCFLSPPGVGKTQMIEEFAAERGVNLVKILCSQMLPTEVAGINVPDGDDFKPLDPWLLKSLKDGDILFFDEWLTAPDMVRNACLTLIKDRDLMSNRELPDIMIVGASNPIATVSQLSTAQRDRFIWVDVKFSRQDFARYIGDRFHKEGAETFAQMCAFDDGEDLARKYNVWTPRAAERWVRWIENDGGQESPYWDNWCKLLRVSYPSLEPYRAIEDYIMAPIKAKNEAEAARKRQEKEEAAERSKELRQRLINADAALLDKAVAKTLIDGGPIHLDEEWVDGKELLDKYGDNISEAPELADLFADEDFLKEVLNHVEEIAKS